MIHQCAWLHCSCSTNRRPSYINTKECHNPQNSFQSLKCPSESECERDTS